MCDLRREYQSARDMYETAKRERRQRLITAAEFQQTKNEMIEAKKALEAVAGPVDY